MVNPALGPQLSHDGVDEGKTSASLAPRLKELVIVVPVYLATNGVADHFVKVGGEGAREVEKLPPKKLSLERDRRSRVLGTFAVDVFESEVEDARTQVAELEVRTEDRGAWLQTVWTGVWLLERRNPRLILERQLQSSQGLCKCPNVPN